MAGEVLSGWAAGPASALPRLSSPNRADAGGAGGAVAGSDVEGVAGAACVDLSGGPVAVVDGFRGWLAMVDVGSLSDRERVDLVASLERVKGAASSGQAR